MIARGGRIFSIHRRQLLGECRRARMWMHFCQQRRETASVGTHDMRAEEHAVRTGTRSKHSSFPPQRTMASAVVLDLLGDRVELL